MCVNLSLLDVLNKQLEDSVDKMNQHTEPNQNPDDINFNVDPEEVHYYQGYDSMCHDALTGLYNGS